ncbi:serine hydrolase [Streptomyces sp. NPDC005955]|uniref:serine hydrolase domain-containing protein n=1 Tax=Streptomyces sp. NPDC005955 TaxID=3364738 RepID=UPI0036B1F0E6
MSDTSTDLGGLLRAGVADGAVPGAVALVARPGRTEIAVVGAADTGGTTPMARDSIFRIASLTKVVTAAAVLTLVEDGTLAPEDPVDRWLPELSSPVVVRDPYGPVDDVVPADRPLTVGDLLTSRAGYGFPADFDLPAVVPLLTELRQGPPRPDLTLTPDEWTATLARVPLLAQPGAQWLYNTTSDLQGVLVARAADRPLPEYLAQRLFEPLGMTDTGFHVPPAKLDRFTSQYRPAGGGALDLVDAPDGAWSRPPSFPSGAGGLVSTLDDWWALYRMLLADGAGADGRRVLAPESVRRMRTDHLTPAQREAGALFLEGQGWGYGGAVDVLAVDPWNVPGRYGWTGGTGTTAHLVPATGTVAILLTQVELAGPQPPTLMRDFWAYAQQG